MVFQSTNWQPITELPAVGQDPPLPNGLMKLRLLGEILQQKLSFFREAGS